KLKRLGRYSTAIAVTLIATACQDLLVENLIEPDRERALGNASDVMAFIGASFDPGFRRVVQGSDGGLNGLVISTLLYASAEQTATLSGGTTSVQALDLQEPRREINNAST